MRALSGVVVRSLKVSVRRQRWTVARFKNVVCH
jgi:hypothetical protein